MENKNMQRRPLMRAGAALAVTLLPGIRQAWAAKEHPVKPTPKPAPKPRPAAAGPATPGPGITTEAALPAAYPDAILPFWDTGQQDAFVSTIGKDANGEPVKIHFARFLRPGAEAAIVIASGRTEGMIKYQELVYDLVRNGYSVFIHDHRGQGFSSRLLEDPMIGHVEAFSDYVADLKTFFVDHVKPTGHKRHILLSHSMGGCIASLYLEQHQRDFDRAVLSSPMHQPNLGAMEEASYFTVSVIDAVGLGDRYIPGGHAYDHKREFDAAARVFTHSPPRWEAAWDAYDANPGAKLGDPSLHWVRVGYAAGRLAQDQAARIVAPVLLLQAGADTVVLASAQQRFADRLNAAHPDSCALVPIPGASHELFIEADEFRTPALDRILAFIAPAS